MNIFNFLAFSPLIFSSVLLKKNNYINYLYFFILAFIFFIVAFRDFIGPDWYVATSVQKDLLLQKIIVIFKTKEPIDALVKYLSAKFQYGLYGVNVFYLSISSAIYAISFNKLNIQNKFTLLLTSIPFFFIFLHINSPRQAAAIFLLIPIFFTNIILIYKLLFFLLSILIHNSLILVLPLIFLIIFFENKYLILNFLKNNFIKSLIFFSIIFLLGIYISNFIIDKFFYYIDVSFLNNSVESPAYYFRAIYFSIFILFGIYFLNRYELKFLEKLIINYYTFVFITTFFISFLSTTVADRLNFHLYLYILYLSYLVVTKLSNINRSKKYIFPILLFNFLFFILWTSFSNSFKDTWIPYKNIFI